MKLFAVLLALQIALSNAMLNSELMINMPYYAYVTFANQAMSFYGGGALISPSHVLTCAANVHGFTNWRLGLGSKRRTLHTTVMSNRAVPHPNYSQQNNVRVNDVAVIFINQPVALTVNIFPIFLPSVNSALSAQPLLNTQGMILGFAGNDSIGIEAEENLQAAHVRTMSESFCLGIYPGADTNQHFCSHDVEQGSNFCLGDQGGPVTIVSRDREVLVGIGSLPGCADRPSLYSRIAPFRTWIQAETGI